MSCRMLCRSPRLLVYLIGEGEGTPVSAYRGMAEGRGSFGEIGQERGGWNQALFMRHGLFSHAPQTKGVFRFYESPSLFLRPFVYS